MENITEQITQQTFHDKEKNIFIKMFFKSGLPHGDAVTYKKDGEVIQKINFINGKMNGEFILFDKNKMKARLIYKDDKIDGKAEYFDENEKVIGIENYKDGKKEGLVEWKDSEGNLIFQENYKNGLLDGERKEFYPNRKLKRKIFFSQGKVIGVPEEFDEKGNRKSAGETKKKSPLQINIIIDAAKKFLLSKLGFE